MSILTRSSVMFCSLPGVLEAVVALLFAMGIAMAASAQGSSSAAQLVEGGAAPRPVVAGAVAARTPAERAIAAAEARIAKNPKDPSAYTALALALSQRARETAGHDYYHQGEHAIEKALALDPNHFEAQRTQVWLLLGEHEFAAARELGLKLNKRNPDDVLLYGFLADACAELGLYDEAEKHVQRMLDMRAPTVASLTRTAYLREIFGNLEGALDAMAMAYRMTPENATEDRAWLLTQIGHLYLQRGNLTMARQVLEQALEAFPGYHYTLANLGTLAAMEGDWKQAVVYYRQRYETAPHPENLFELADAQERAGEMAAAEASFRKFEKEALLEAGGHDSANRELIAYYARNAKTAPEAWKLAERELQRRQDVFTLARAAEAAMANGNTSEAWNLVDRVLKTGYRDADVLYLAGRVVAERGEISRSREFFAEAAAFNPKAPSARLAMERLKGGGSTAVAGR